MAVSNLNVRVGFLFDEKGLKQMERSMRAAGQRLSNLGNELTTSFTLPLAAIGAAAFKSAGDIESLQLAMESQLGSAEAARKEIELLRKEALKPGLGFEQAVRGSVSLQAVGFSAEKAREVISRFGNALALAGKGGAELDGVVLALTQIKAKGIVSAEEINQIAERLPQIRTLMLQAFGTASTEAIQKLGITADQFITGITDQMKNLPQAAGGIKNSLENFFDALKNGAAKLGLAIQNAFDVTGKLESFANFVNAAADGFASLNPAVQDFVLGLGLVLIAAGPVAKVFGAVQLAGAQVVGLWAGMISTAGGLKAAVLGLADSVNRLKLAFGIVGIVAAVATGIYLLSQRFDAATYAQEQFANATKAVADESAKELGALDKNFAVLKNINSTNGERKAAIDALLNQYPAYFKGMNLEIQSVDQLTSLHKGLVEQIQRGVAERKKAEAVNSIYEKRAEILLRVQQLRDGADATTGEASLINTGDMVRAGGIAEAVIQKLLQQSDDLAASADKTGKQFDTAFGLVGAAARRASPASQVLGELKPVADKAAESTKNFGAGMAVAAKTTKEAKTELDIYLDRLREQESLQNKIREAAASMGLAPLESLPQAGTGPVASNAPVETPDFSSFATLATTITPAQAALDALNSGLFTFNELFTVVSENVATNGTLMQQAILGASQAMQEAAASGASSFGTLAGAAVSAAAKIVRAYIQQGVAAAVAKALTGLPFPLNIAAAAGAGALAAAAFNKILGAIKVPGFAKGTDFAPGGIALVGERGPELVNLPRGSQVTPNNQLNGMMGGGVNVSGTFRIQGTDLVVVLEKAQKDMRRTRGF